MAGGGGAWKVAYADFVTAMMALFMVLWISAQDQEILIATSQYFQSPFNSPMDASMGVLSDGAGSGSNQSSGEDVETSMADTEMLNKLARDFYKHLNIDETQDDAPLEVTVTNDGLRVRVYDRNERPIFSEDGAKFTEWGEFVMQNLAWLIERRPFKVRIDGHTAAGEHRSTSEYGAWELSADRANATRRALQYYAVPAEKIEQVSGFGSTVTIDGVPAESRSNDRIELSLVVLEPLRPTSVAH